MNNNKNELYPIFLKLHELKVIIIGGGNVGFEKLSFMLKSSPNARVTMVALEFSEEITTLLETLPNHKVTLIQRAFNPFDLFQKDLVIAATNHRGLNWSIRQTAKAQGILVNVADTPDLCDFYLGGIVTKGDLKIAISTNGKSPTFAKRLRQLLEEVIPDETNLLLQNLREIRNRIKGDFAYKVKTLNDLTENLIK